MAPRGHGRSRKVPKGQTRMDAALDSMKGYGFPEELIVTTIRELLDVYDVEGWPFIEEASYKVLLESILEKVEKQANEKEKSDNEGVNNNTKASASGSSTTPPLPTCSNKEVLAVELMSTVTQVSVSEATEVPEMANPTEGSVCEAYLSNTKGERSRCWNKNQTNNGQGTEDGSCGGDEEVGISRSHSPSQFGIGSEPEEEAIAFQRRSRGPYHGWISDSDEPIELVELKPAPLPFQLAELLPRTGSSKNRKRRWDEKAPDISAL